MVNKGKDGLVRTLPVCRNKEERDVAHASPLLRSHELQTLKDAATMEETVF